ncbi:putative Tyrosine-protein phosphatase pmp1 [Glarea lozoyensis 74030]|uniref:protein-tyrosine-phosphatase n=1 Tax=Glarea lozoyensis (strain ATCC 74030 / MF5533) TaxID=1104152 RepID=H0EXF5_GLAL7|nr:putative Tyrosine-protein phosphatase pmp1 [Glarea lozoyensis 74030]
MLTTPGFGPSGGMTLGMSKPRGVGPSRFKESSLQTNTFAISEEADHEPSPPTQMATRIPGVMVGGDSFDRPNSGEDAKSPSYPNGPILMWEPSVHLYMEPNAEEACEFDLVINVAREVKNPFNNVPKEQTAGAGNHATLTHNPKPVDSADVPPDTAASMLSFRTAFETQPPSSTDSSPTTPRPMMEPREPEYIHMPWDHNTDVKDELWDLCEKIDTRVKEGKRVLIHCQQGASRSATLVIAYGMYIHPELNPTQAYQKAQEKSKWVNPNMSLLFSLNDFKKILDSKKNETATTAKRTTISRHRPTLSTGTIDLPSTPSRARGNSTPGVTAREAATDAKEKDVPASDSAISRFSDFDFGFNKQPQIQPHFRHEAPSEDDWEALMSPRVSEMTQNPFNVSPKPKAEPFGTGFGQPSVEAESEPALFSPRAFEFPQSSFFPTPPPQRVTPAVVRDPRSPPTKAFIIHTTMLELYLTSEMSACFGTTEHI